MKPGEEVVSTWKYTLNGVEHVVERTEVYNPIVGLNPNIKESQTIASPFAPGHGGWANLSSIKDVPNAIRVNYWLSTSYQADDYRINLANRNHIGFNVINWDLGALVIPFKIHPGYKDETKNVDVPDRIVADYNIGLFGGFSMGRQRYRYETGELKELASVKFTTGLFVGIGKQDLDSTLTLTAAEPLAEGVTRSMMVVTTGVGMMLSVADIKLGIFGGWDLGTGDLSSKWDHHARWWVGVGLGYNLAGLLGGKK